MTKRITSNIVLDHSEARRRAMRARIAVAMEPLLIDALVRAGQDPAAWHKAITSDKPLENRALLILISGYLKLPEVDAVAKAHADQILVPISLQNWLGKYPPFDDDPSPNEHQEYIDCDKPLTADEDDHQYWVMEDVPEWVEDWPFTTNQLLYPICDWDEKTAARWLLPYKLPDLILAAHSKFVSATSIYPSCRPGLSALQILKIMTVKERLALHARVLDERLRREVFPRNRMARRLRCELVIRQVLLGYISLVEAYARLDEFDTQAEKDITSIFADSPSWAAPYVVGHLEEYFLLQDWPDGFSPQEIQMFFNRSSSELNGV